MRSQYSENDGGSLAVGGTGDEESSRDAALSQINGCSECVPPAASLRQRRVQVVKIDVHAMQAAVIRDCLLKSLFESINLSG
jgi:hypothetical protein